MAAIDLYFHGFPLLVSFTATTLTLILKVASATSLAQLRPISLCNFSNKIISRIISSRLASFLPILISEEQVGFVQGRCIHENVCLAHDLAHDLNNKTFGGNVIIKLDMAKAYDRVSWSFLLAALRAYDFREGAFDLILRCITNCRYSVKWDGKLYGCFHSRQGVRQGDPLSPTLFVLAIEWLSKALNNAVITGSLQNYYTAPGALPINHLLFVDDLLIFTNCAKHYIKWLLAIIQVFCSISGQCLNPSKSQIIFSSTISQVRGQDILTLTGFAQGRLPLQYLGVPLYRGRTNIPYFKFLIECLAGRVRGWLKQYMSLGGHID
ncbi:hypothetical protein QQ045_000135 [Rhodiola kirilowii]